MNRRNITRAGRRTFACLLLSALSSLPACAGCDDTARGAAPPEEAASRPSAEAVPDLDERDQYALLRAIVEAKSASEEDQASLMEAVRASWVGRRYRWEVLALPPLCRRPSSCAIALVDYERMGGRPGTGFLPILSMTAPVHRDLLARCESHPPCVLAFEGELRELTLSPGQPTSMRLELTRILATRAMAEDEAWLAERRPPPTPP